MASSLAGPDTMRGVVTDDVAEAAGALRSGADVLLIVAEGSAEAAVARRAGEGRLALMVGDAADPAVRQAAEEMAAELFGRR